MKWFLDEHAGSISEPVFASYVPRKKGGFDGRSKERGKSGSFKGDVANIEIDIQALESEQVASVPDDKYSLPK